jgi:hypothetical protein
MTWLRKFGDVPELPVGSCIVSSNSLASNIRHPAVFRVVPNCHLRVKSSGCGFKAGDIRD